MHKQLIAHATTDQLKEFITDFITMLKNTNTDLYELAEDSLYDQMYSDHFNDWSLQCALESIENEDGSIGAHWSLEETNQVAKSLGYTLVHYNEYDWNYTMNMLWSDYAPVLGNSTETYGKLAHSFLCDKDAPEGKAYKYYKAMK